MPKEAMLRATSMALLFAIVSSQCGPENKEAFPPGQTACPPATGPPGGGEGGGTTDYTKGAPLAAPLRGKVGSVDNPIAADKTQIYGPFEAGFSKEQTQTLFKCSPGVDIPGGIDTLTAEQMVQHACKLPSTTTVLDACGGHATPYHYHERFTCLYKSDNTTGHSTRIGTMLDGKGLYGKYVAKDKLPTDLDACGGRTGVTPDSNGKAVYYYMVQDKAPFTVGCFGPVDSLAACKTLYKTCGDDQTSITTAEGTRLYDADCPCYGASTSTSTSSDKTSSSSSYLTSSTFSSSLSVWSMCLFCLWHSSVCAAPL